MARADNEPNLAETLETLRQTLDPKAFQLAKASLEADILRRHETAELATDRSLMAQLVEGYDYTLMRSKAGYAHVDGLLLGSSYTYLDRKSGVEVASELDMTMRLYSSYAICHDPESSDNVDGTLNRMRLAEVEPHEVFKLVQQYWQKNKIWFTASWGFPDGYPRDLEETLEREVLHGGVYWEYYPAPGLAEQIRKELINTGVIKK